VYFTPFKAVQVSIIALFLMCCGPAAMLHH
jgi:hypothetical protein